MQVSAGGATLVRTVKAASSYLSQNDLRVHVALAAAKTVDRIDVRWPTGRREAGRGVRTGHLATIRGGLGLVGSTPLVR